jgi:hypothetical protein
MYPVSGPPTFPGVPYGANLKERTGPGRGGQSAGDGDVQGPCGGVVPRAGGTASGGRFRSRIQVGRGAHDGVEAI